MERKNILLGFACLLGLASMSTNLFSVKIRREEPKKEPPRVAPAPRRVAPVPRRVVAPVPRRVAPPVPAPVRPVPPLAPPVYVPPAPAPAYYPPAPPSPPASPTTELIRQLMADPEFRQLIADMVRQFAPVGAPGAAPAAVRPGEMPTHAQIGAMAAAFPLIMKIQEIRRANPGISIRDAQRQAKRELGIE